jgi:hypothetical protein
VEVWQPRAVEDGGDAVRAQRGQASRGGLRADVELGRDERHLGHALPRAHAAVVVIAIAAASERAAEIRNLADDCRCAQRTGGSAAGVAARVICGAAICGEARLIFLSGSG